MVARHRPDSVRLPAVRWLLVLCLGEGCIPDGAPAASSSGTTTECTVESWWRDADGDGFGSDAVLEACAAPDARWVAVTGDCDDFDPTRHPQHPESDTPTCHDGRDNDCDATTDCDDPDCATACTENCGNAFDDDNDGLTDCDDPECRLAPECKEDCTNGIDDDNDGFTDCRDLECRGAPECDEDCSNGIDDDADSYIDCSDSDCRDAPNCNEDCTNGIDDDANGRIDCDDPRCTDDPACPEDCTNGIDDDADGRTDCEDAECSDEAHCTEDCTNGRDDDGDGRADCRDDECWGDSDCTSIRAAVTGGHMRAGWSRLTSPGDAHLSVQVQSVTGWVSTHQETAGWRACQWTVGPWSNMAWYPYLSTGVLTAQRDHVSFSGSCAATETDLPQDLYFRFPGTPLFAPGGRRWYELSSGVFGDRADDGFWWMTSDITPGETWFGE